LPPAPPAPSGWHSAGEPGVRLQVPGPLAPETTKSDARAAQPDPTPPPARPEVEERQSLSPLPVGIAHFTEIKPESIAAGFRPHPTDGIPWLQGKGYRTVLHFRQPGSSDANDRRLMEKYGLKFISLEVAPELLTRDLVDQVTAIAADNNSLPLFIYDTDGNATGAVFFLYFRLRDNMSEEKAKSRAAQLGLRDETTPEGQAWWIAIRKILPPEK
jgi:hypothetical protein